MKPFGAFSLLVRGVAWIVGAGVLTLLLAGDVTSRLDNALYDFHMRHWQYKPSGDVVVVAVDPESIDALGSWPWPRAIHGKLIDKLTDLGVGPIGMDVMFAWPDAKGPENDRLLAEAIRRHGRVVMAMYAAASEPGGPLKDRLPIPDVASAAVSFGEIVDVPVDSDGLTRRAFLQGGVGRPYWPLLPLAVYQLDHPEAYGGARGKHESPPLQGEPATWSRGDEKLIRYAGPAGTFLNVSYADVLNGRADPALLKGKAVLLGNTAPGIGDRFVIPGAQSETLMPGVEYMANVLESLRRGMLITPLGFAGCFLLGMAALAFPLLIYGWPGMRRSWVVATISVAATLLASLLLLRLASIWWPPASAMVIVVGGAIVWGMLAPRLTRERNAESE